MKTPLEHYRTLELEVGASEEELRAAFRRLAKQHHPDRQQGDRDGGKRFREIVEAFRFLKEYQASVKSDEDGLNHPRYAHISPEMRNMPRQVRLHPRRKPKDKDKDKEKQSRRGPRIRIRAPFVTPIARIVPSLTNHKTKTEYYSAIVAIAFLLITALGTLISITIKLLRTPAPEPAAAPSYTQEEKEKMVEVFIDTEGEKDK